MKPLHLACLWISVLLAAVSPASAAPTDKAEIVDFAGWNGPKIRVFLLKPDGAGPDAPVIFVMHGVKRDADRYFDDWREWAEARGFVLAVPEFSSADFKGAANYNLGGVVDEGGALADRTRWSYSAIEPLFDFIVERYELSANNYILYGHSAGAQYAHRFAMFGAGARARLVIAANAGWYTFPDGGEWPYGPVGLPEGAFDPDAALAAPLVVLAGEADIDPQHPSLRRTPEANAQGATRFARAQAFFAAGKAAAVARGSDFNWSCVTAPGVDHNDAKAARFAVALAFAPPEAGGECRRGEPAE